MKNLEIYLQVLQAGAHEKKNILGTIEELKSCTPQELSDNKCACSGSCTVTAAGLSSPSQRTC